MNGRVYMKYQSKKNNLYILFSTFLLIGIVIGSIAANEKVCGNNIFNFILTLLGLDFDRISINQTVKFLNFFSNYIVYILFIWIFGFTALAVYLDTFLISLKGFIYGFIVSAFYIKYNLMGIILYSINYTIPALIFLPIQYRISYISIQYSINKYNYFSIFKETKRYKAIENYILELLIALLGLIFVFIIQMYITNPIIQKIGL